MSGKRFEKVRKSLKEGALDLDAAVAVVKKTASAKFDETVDIAVRLVIDTKGGQGVRGVVDLPAGTGKTVRVAVFARDAKAKEAQAAGADIVGAEDLVERIEKGDMPFDRCVATPDMMGLVGRLGRFLGPRGLMPNPKLGTVTPDVEKAVKASKGGQIEYRADKAGVVHAGVGKASFAAEQLKDNIRTFMDVLAKARPQGTKGVYMKSIYVSCTMGPSVQLSTGDFIEA